MPCLISTSAHLLEFRKFPCRFGTHADNELVAQEGMGVQGLHFTLRREGVRIVLTAAPESPTTVNGNDIRRANIQDGDRIQVGQLMLIYSNPSGQQNHLAGQMNAKQPMALPSPTAHALPSPATSRQVVPPADAPKASAEGHPTAAPAFPQSHQASQVPPSPTQGAVQGQQSAQTQPQETMPTAATMLSAGAPAHQTTRLVPEGTPKALETTPSNSFMAWAKAADKAKVSLLTERVTAAISAQEAASQPVMGSVPKPKHDQTARQATPPAMASQQAAMPQVSPMAVTASQVAPDNPFAGTAEQSATLPVDGKSMTQAPQQSPPANPFAEAAQSDLASVFS